jgi:hypothetical protein
MGAAAPDNTQSDRWTVDDYFQHLVRLGWSSIKARHQMLERFQDDKPIVVTCTRVQQKENGEVKVTSRELSKSEWRGAFSLETIEDKITKDVRCEVRSTMGWQGQRTEYSFTLSRQAALKSLPRRGILRIKIEGVIESFGPGWPPATMKPAKIVEEVCAKWNELHSDEPKLVGRQQRQTILRAVGRVK